MGHRAVPANHRSCRSIEAEPARGLDGDRCRLDHQGALIDVDAKAKDLTQGWLRASRRALDPVRSKPYRPVHPHDHADPIVPSEPTWFDIAIVPTAQRFKPGQHLRLIITSADEDFAMQGISHVTCGLAAKNQIFSASRLMVPIIPSRAD
jgi:uncharacterized protein